MIHELRTYILRAGALPEYERLVKLYGRPARADNYGKLEGHWSSPLGDQSRLFTLWKFESLAERERLRLALAKNAAWQSEFLPRIAGLVLSKTNTILSPIRGLKPPDTSRNVYELRTHRVRGSINAWLRAFEQALPAQETCAWNVAVWSTEIGNLGDILHLWAHESLEQIASAWAKLREDAAWKEFLVRTAGTTDETRSDVLLPTSMCPMHTGPNVDVLR